MAARGTKDGNGARARLKDWLTQLMMASGLSGHEGPVRRLLAKQLSELGIASRSDRMGNLIATLPGDKSLPSVMLFAHMDQLGLVVRKIEANGLLRVERVGGVPEKALPSQSVRVSAGKGKTLPGIIANKSHHATQPDEKYKVLPYSDLYIDCGFGSAAEIQAAGVVVGAPIVYAPNVLELAGNRVVGTSVDDRAGCAVMLEVARTPQRQCEAADPASGVLGAGGVQPARRGHGGAGAQARHRDPARPHPRDRHARHDPARRRQAGRRAGHQPLQLPRPRHTQRHHSASGAGRAVREDGERREDPAPAQRPYRRAHRFLLRAGDGQRRCLHRSRLSHAATRIRRWRCATSPTSMAWRNC